MWTKLKEFFDKKAVIVIEGILMILVVSGIVANNLDINETAKSITSNISSIVLGIESIITLIQGISKKKSVETKEV